MISPYWNINWSDYWITTEDFHFINIKGDKETIPKWFITDFGSYPRLVWIFYTPLNLTYLKANLIHDYRYSNKYKWDMTREQIDNEFLENYRNYWTIFPIISWLRVRLFWASHYKKDLPFDKKTINLD